MTPLLRLRNVVGQVVDRTPPLRRGVVRMWASMATRRGADPVLVQDALATAAERPVLRTAQKLQWATALAGTGRSPRYFRPETEFDASGREHIRRTIQPGTTRDPHLVRQLWALTELEELPTLIAEVGRELPALLRASREAPRAWASADDQLRVIDQLSQALERAGHRPFPISGTLLGIVRDGAPMSTDYDIDLGLLPGDGEPLPLAATVNAIPGLHAELSPGRVIVTSDAGIKVDLFLHIERAERFWHQTEIHEWWNTPFELERRTVAGIELWSPVDAERYLEENYGPSWTAPAMFYDMSFDTPNRRYLHSPAAVTYLVRRALVACETGDRWTYEASLRALDEAFGITWPTIGGAT